MNLRVYLKSKFKHNLKLSTVGHVAYHMKRLDEKNTMVLFISPYLYSKKSYWPKKVTFYQSVTSSPGDVTFRYYDVTVFVTLPVMLFECPSYLHSLILNGKVVDSRRLVGTV